jgi:hypothetical protein
MPDKPLIFISHSHADQEIVKWLSEMLEKVFAGGVEIFATSLEDKNVPTGLPWLSYIVEQMDKASVILVVLTPQSQNRPWVWFELGNIWKRYIDQSIRIIPLVSNIQTSSLPYPFLTLQTKELSNKDDVKAAFEDMIKFLDKGLIKNLPRNARYKEATPQKPQVPAQEQKYRSSLFKALSQLMQSRSLDEANLLAFRDLELIDDEELYKLQKMYYGKD